jgi:hypothetical protein
MTHELPRTTPQRRRVAGRPFAAGILAAAAIAIPAASFLSSSAAVSSAGGTSMVTSASDRGMCLTPTSRLIVPPVAPNSCI